jgi:hypothetical protein
VVYDPVARCQLDEGLCARVRAEGGWDLLRAPDGHWFAHRPWTGATRPVGGGVEGALVQGYQLGERLLARCAVLAPREAEVELEETSAAACLQGGSPAVRAAVAACRDAGFSAGLVEWALRTVDVEANEAELFEGVRVVQLGALLGAS